DITDQIVTVNPVDTTTPGTYTVTYNVTDAAGNAAEQVTRTVNVEDTTPPVITLNGDAEVTVEAGDTWTDPGATATDIVDGDLTDAIVAVGDVNTNVPASYTIIY